MCDLSSELVSQGESNQEMSARHATALAQQAVELEHMRSEHAEAFEAALTASGRADALAMQLEQQHIAQQHQLAEAAAAAASAQLAEFERIRGAEHTKALAELQQQQMQERGVSSCSQNYALLRTQQ